MNGDGKPDLTITGRGVSVCLGQGDGTFKPGLAWDTAETFSGLLFADVNADGRSDMILLNPVDSSSVWVAKANAAGGFDSPAVFDLPWINEAQQANTTTGLAVADFNRDGLPDLAVADYFQLRVLLNQSAPGPRLTIASQSQGERLILDWPTTVAGTGLESTATLNPPQWQSVLEKAVQHGTQWELNLPIAGSSRFFRLRVK